MKVKNEKQKFKEFLKKVEDPNYNREVNRSLPENPTSLQVAKYKLCKKILGYKLDNKLTREQVADKMGLSKAETEDILFCEIEKFTLDRLMTYASQLFAPFQIEKQSSAISKKRDLTPKIIACLSQKGGGGKSTLARCLAVELTKQKFNGIRPLINCQSLPFFDEKLTKSQYDYLIIDGPAKISKESLLIAKQANLIIQPVRPSLDDLNPAIREFNGLFKAGIPKNKLSFVINAAGSPAMEKATRDYLAPAGYYVFPLALEEKVSYQEAQNQGLSIGEVKYKRLQEQEYQQETTYSIARNLKELDHYPTYCADCIMVEKETEKKTTPETKKIKKN
ncbi:9089_t:CDS:2 [Ambispora gerdemannii]|uniref:9089_t:CDS:1 n=1 Tax=Ambispora gerdemannii TaxID=144530 RepID=A0A9N8YUD6_9GLOM|nr:9089_t:CDS:2 [Ambispora gerdemannii]